MASVSGRALTALEVVAVYAGILLYIWRWQFNQSWLWMPMLAFVVLTHRVHHDSLTSLGLGPGELRANAQIILPLAAAVLAPVTIWGLWSGRLRLFVPTHHALEYFAVYFIWCCFQQYLAQSYIHNRLMSISSNSHFTSVLVGLMFGAAHIPNPVLMAVTFVGGVVLSEVFARHRSLWPLAFAQAVTGALVGALVPAAMIHNMRVGPGYFFYGLH